MADYTYTVEVLAVATALFAVVYPIRWLPRRSLQARMGAFEGYTSDGYSDPEAEGWDRELAAERDRLAKENRPLPEGRGAGVYDPSVAPKACPRCGWHNGQHDSDCEAGR